MRCALATLGSRGDVEPFILLAFALADRGHDVTLALDEGWATLPSLARLPSSPRVTLSPLGTMSRDELADAVAQSVGAATPLARSRAGYHAFIGRRRAELRERLTTLAATHELLVVSDPLAIVEAGRLAWTTPTTVVWHTPSSDGDYERLRAIECLRLAALPELLAPREPRLAEAMRFTGFWRARASAVPSPEVERFVHAGAPPLFLTMGSMVGFDAAALVAAFIVAARARGRRVILQRGWAELAAPPAEDLLVVGELDYATLFPRCAALFIHGGTGTMAGALLAGRPLGLLPLVEDQVAWARVAAEWGVSVGTIDPRAPQVDALDAAMARIDDAAVARAAAQLAGTLARERGLDAACDAIARFSAG